MVRQIDFAVLQVELLCYLANQKERFLLKHGQFQKVILKKQWQIPLEIIVGLLPDTTYVIKVAKRDGVGSSSMERASPDSIPVKVGTEDMKGLDFVVFEEPEMTIMSCDVEGSSTEEQRKHLVVEIKSASDAAKIQSVFPLPISNFFQVKDLPKGRYLLGLRSSLPASSLKFESDIIEVDLEKNARVHVRPLGYRLEEDQLKQELTPAPVFPLTVGVLFLSMPRLKELYQAALDMPMPTGGLAATLRRELRKSMVRKKTY